MTHNYKLWISVVSHGNEALIQQNFNRELLANSSVDIQVSVMDNVGSDFLRSYCQDMGFKYFCDHVTRGYGANHNLNFQKLELNDNDFFLVVNPDVDLTQINWVQLLSNIQDETGITGVQVYESKDLKKYSSHARLFPALFDPVISLIFHKKLFELDFHVSRTVDWIGGAFMLFRAKSFHLVKGFDESFFMYYEDVDICRRIKKIGYKITYNPDYYIIHTAKREGRKLFSKSLTLSSLKDLTISKVLSL